jgi:hypothetical protein
MVAVVVCMSLSCGNSPRLLECSNVGHVDTVSGPGGIGGGEIKGSQFSSTDELQDLLVPNAPSLRQHRRSQLLYHGFSLLLGTNKKSGCRQTASSTGEPSAPAFAFA